jgi:hypothetical protein
MKVEIGGNPWPEGLVPSATVYVSEVDPLAMRVGIVVVRVDERAERYNDGRIDRWVRGVVQNAPLVDGYWKVGAEFAAPVDEVFLTEGDARADAIAAVNRYIAAGQALVRVLVGKVNAGGLYDCGVDLGVQDMPMEGGADDDDDDDEGGLADDAETLAD